MSVNNSTLAAPRGNSYAPVVACSRWWWWWIKAGTRFGDPRGMQGWVDLVDLVHTEVVYLPEDVHPSQY